ncbi:MAG: manganese efflux pump MntP family protein [Oscillospiraceae bacterium]
MGLTDLLLLAIGLSMDAFAVSVTNGLCVKNINWKGALACGLCFGLYQGAMPTIGFALGKAFESIITSVDHFIALILLGIIGGKMIFDGIKAKDETENAKTKLTLSILMIQGIATSIDALAVGVSFAALSVNIVSAAAFICCVTFAFSFAGVYIGRKFGTVLNNKAEIVGGIILVGIGVKIFIEHMFFS